jgi:hypothetical protein
MAYSKAKLKSNGDKVSPCFRPFSIGIHQTDFYLCGFCYRFCLNTDQTVLFAVSGSNAGECIYLVLLVTECSLLNVIVLIETYQLY